MLAKQGRSVGISVQTAELDDNAVTTAKINALAVTTAKIDALAVTNAKINDVAASKITGQVAVANGGTGLSALGAANQVLRTNGAANALEFANATGTWTKLEHQELGAAAAHITSDTFTAKEQLHIVAHLRTDAGTHAARVRFGNAGTIDSGNNYRHYRLNAGTYETGASQSGVLMVADTVRNEDFFVVIDVINYAARAKAIVGLMSNTNSNGGFVNGAWDNTSNQITNVSFRADIDGGTDAEFGAGAEIEVWGRNFND